MAVRRPLLLFILAILVSTTFAGNHNRHQRQKRHNDLHDWLTEEQKETLKGMDQTSSEFKAQVGRYYNDLSPEKRAEWDKFYKTHCFEWTAKVQTADEETEFQKNVEESNVQKVQERVGQLKEKVDAEQKKSIEMWEQDCYNLIKPKRMRREIEAAFKDFVKWMTPEQLGEITALKAAGKDAEVGPKVKELFAQLPADRQATLKEEFKGHCKVYFTPLMTADELEKIKTLKGDKEAAGALVKTVVDRQVGEVKTIAEKMMTVCGEVYKDSSRKRREIEPAFQDFVKWMTPEQLGEITALKAAGKEAGPRVKELFAQLPAEQQRSLKEEFKGKCRTYFTPLMTADELEKIKTLKADKEGAGALVKTVVDRQVGEVKAVAEKMMTVCGEVYKESSRKRREIEAAFKDFVQWMTPEQLGEITALKAAGKSASDLQEKTKEFFALLPADRQASLKEEFKGKCRTYFTPLMTADELEKIKTLKGDKEAAGALVKNVVDRQIGEVKDVSEKMLGVCGEVYKDSSRKRREIEPAFKDFVQWMTPEQLGEITALKASGKDADVQAKVKEFFGQLPADKQATLKEEFKGKCKAYFAPLMTPDESEKIKTLVASGDKDGAKTLIKGVVDRQIADVKTVAEKMYDVCGEVFKESKAKRDVAAKIEKHLSWLQAAEKEEILQMTNDGKSKDEIKKRLLEIVEAKEKDSVEKEQAVKRCYAWMEEVATKEEIESLHKLHHVDHGACKKKVREFIAKLPQEKQQDVEASLPFCEKLWYGDHASHEGHGDHAHHHRRRRHLAVIQEYVKWLAPEQKSDIEKLEASGAEFYQIADKIKEFFLQLPEDQQKDLKENFQHQCMIWAKEVSKPLEWEEIKKAFADKDYAHLKSRLVELEGRLTENQKHTIEHVRGVCYKLWGIPGVSRRIRQPEESAEKTAKYLSWMNEDQLKEVQRLKTEGKKVEVVKAILKFFDETTGDVKVEAEEKLKEACRDMSLKVFGEEKVAQFKKLKEENAEAAEMEKLAEGFISEIPEGEKKEKAQAVLIGCKHVYGSRKSRRDLIAREVAEYFQNSW